MVYLRRLQTDIVFLLSLIYLLHITLFLTLSTSKHLILHGLSFSKFFISVRVIVVLSFMSIHCISLEIKNFVFVFLAVQLSVSMCETKTSVFVPFVDFYTAKMQIRGVLNQSYELNRKIIKQI